ncbi:MAG TPA: hypothetical protein VLI42_06390 [Chthoniobacterales bacterium]|nr:hypothetical protein [Chthoniobacterales bacterium]
MERYKWSDDRLQASTYSLGKYRTGAVLEDRISLVRFVGTLRRDDFW